MALSNENKVINGLWIGKQLSTIELLTLHSFIRHGHEFHLWVYDHPDNILPVNVVLRDAKEIIPANEIFVRKHNDPQYNIGKGSVGSPFSDLFRYKLLYTHGGWWVDMDVTCLKPLDIEAPYFFRSHPLLPMIGNVIKVPPRSRLMQDTWEEVKASCNEETLEWLLPNKILNKHIAELNLSGFIQNNYSAPDWWEKIEVFIKTNKRFPRSWFFIHWMNEEWRTRQVSKNNIYTGTAFGGICEEYGFSTIPYPLLLRLKSQLRYIFK